jgi:soluble lytic murein transglycosylase
MLAAFDTDQSIDAAISATVPMAIERDPLLHPHELTRLIRAEQFIAEGARDLAAQELKDFRARDGLSSPFLMYLAMLQFEARAYATAFTLLGDLSSRGFDGAASSSFLRMIFPLAYMDIVRKYAAEMGLDPILVLSLIKQESAFEVSAISSSGALGLMQLMPTTASDTDPKIKRVDLVEAEHNIRVGTKYLKQLMTRFNGNIVLSLAGYNAGPNAADRWMKAAPTQRSMLEFIETIPYKETREYVSSIIRNYFWYSKRINGASDKSLAYFWNVYGPPEKPAALPEVR